MDDVKRQVETIQENLTDIQINATGSASSRAEQLQTNIFVSSVQEARQLASEIDTEESKKILKEVEIPEAIRETVEITPAFRYQNTIVHELKGVFSEIHTSLRMWYALALIFRDGAKPITRRVMNMELIDLIDYFKKVRGRSPTSVLLRS